MGKLVKSLVIMHSSPQGGGGGGWGIFQRLPANYLSPITFLGQSNLNYTTPTSSTLDEAYCTPICIDKYETSALLPLLSTWGVWFIHRDGLQWDLHIGLTLLL